MSAQEQRVNNIVRLLVLVVLVGMAVFFVLAVIASF